MDAQVSMTSYVHCFFKRHIVFDFCDQSLVIYIKFLLLFSPLQQLQCSNPPYTKCAIAYKYSRQRYPNPTFSVDLVNTKYTM